MVYFQIEAIDGGTPPRTGTCLLKISVIDVNDHEPFFPVYDPVPVKESEWHPYTGPNLIAFGIWEWKILLCKSMRHIHYNNSIQIWGGTHTKKNHVRKVEPC